jgi:lipoprotein signal peptidase
VKWRLAAVAIPCLTVLDGFFKYLAIKYLPNDQIQPLNVGIDLALHKNPGIAFNIPLPLGIVLPITLVALMVFAVIAYKNRLTNILVSLSAVAVMFGATNNGLDRLINGFTTDYIILFRTSAINLSDALIFFGILSLFWYDRRNPQSTA